MPISDNKILTPITTISDLERQPTPNQARTWDQMQALFDKSPEALRVKLNALIDFMQNTTTDCGAKSIGVNTIAGITGNDVQTVLANLLIVAQQAQAGTIGVGTITDAMLSNTVGQIKNIVNTNLTDAKYQLATGTGTNIILTTQSLIDGYSKTFIASADNNGAATVINNKQLYKPNTLITPTLIQGKAYTVWYNLIDDCFFIKASAEGDVVVGEVLAGKKFSNDNDTGLIGTLALTGNVLSNDVINGKTFYNTDAKTKNTGTLLLTGSAIPGDLLSGKTAYNIDAQNKITGTMTDRGTVNITPSTVNQSILDGKHSGSGVVLGDADLIASNILNTASIFNVQGTAIAGKRWATGTGTSNGGGSFVVTGLMFNPRIISCSTGGVGSTSYLYSTMVHSVNVTGVNGAGSGLCSNKVNGFTFDVYVGAGVGFNYECWE